MRNSADAVPLACVPAAIPAAERSSHFALARKLFTDLAKERQELPNGYAFRFEADELETLSRFIANERKCCPFMTFELEIAPTSGPIWLRMSGPEGTRGVLDAELNRVRIVWRDGRRLEASSLRWAFARLAVYYRLFS